MSEWQGFDQRKICPRCGDYQTRVTSKQRQSLSSPRFLFSILRYIGIAIVPILAIILLYLRYQNIFLLGLFFMGFVGLVIFYAYKSIYSGKNEIIDQPSREKNRIGYNLYCRNCGHAWEMSIEEWMTSGRKEKENIKNVPSRFPTGKSSLKESLEKTEWRPPDPNRGIFVVVGFAVLFLIVSLLLYGVFWAKAHPQNPNSIVVIGIAAIFALIVFAGLLWVFKPKTSKTAFIILILVTIIGLALAALRFLSV